MKIHRLLSRIHSTEVIAVGSAIRELDALNATYGKGEWRKLKGIANIETERGDLGEAEIHWYEAQGIGKRKMKMVRFI